MFDLTMPRQQGAQRAFVLWALGTALLLLSLTNLGQQAFSGIILPNPTLQPLAVLTEAKEAQPAVSADRIFVKGAGSNSAAYLLASGTKVQAQAEDETRTLRTRKESALDFINRISLPIPEDSLIVLDVSTQPVTLSFWETGSFTDTFLEVAPAQTIRTPDHTLPKGTEVVTQVGLEGTCRKSYTFTVTDGRITWMEPVAETENTSLPNLVTYGTQVSRISEEDRIVQVLKQEDGSGHLVFASGDSLPFTGSLSCTATAYTSGYGGVGTITASGVTVNSNTVAVDPDVIPMGSHMYITTPSGSHVFGMGHAEDTGSSIKGNKVDLYLPTYDECISFGRRTVDVYLLD